MSSDGSAAQLSFSSGPLARGLRVWMARATSSLPVPRSPVTSTLARALGRAPDLLDELLDGGALADELPGRPRGAAQVARLGLGAREAQRGLDGDEQRVGVERLLEEVERADADGAHRGVDGRVAAHHDDGRVAPFAGRPSRRASARAARRRRRRGASRRRGTGRRCASSASPRRPSCRRRRRRRSPRARGPSAGWSGCEGSSSTTRMWARGMVGARAQCTPRRPGIFLRGQLVHYWTRHPGWRENRRR